MGNFARSLGVSIPEAAGPLQQAQRNWTAYLRTYWPTQSLAPETFAATFNTAALDEDRLVRCIVSVTTQPSVTVRRDQAAMSRSSP
jgi:hypothetical protein